jgi:hypothetical protein
VQMVFAPLPDLQLTTHSTSHCPSE